MQSSVLGEIPKWPSEPGPLVGPTWTCYGTGGRFVFDRRCNERVPARVTGKSGRGSNKGSEVACASRGKRIPEVDGRPQGGVLALRRRQTIVLCTGQQVTNAVGRGHRTSGR